MSVTSTTLKPISKKRELSSPEELSELKKNKTEETEDSSMADTTKHDGAVHHLVPQSLCRKTILRKSLNS